MCPPPGSAWPGWAAIAAASSASWSGAIRWPRSPAARSRRAGRDVRRAVPRHRLALGPPAWGTWWVWDGRLTSMLVLLFLYLGYIALAVRPSASAAARAGSPRSSGWSARSTSRSSIIRCCGGTRCTRARASRMRRLGDRARFLWPLPLTMLGFSLIFGGVVLMRMRAMLAEAKLEARLRAERRARMNPWPFVIAAYALAIARDAGAGRAGLAGDARGRGRRARRASATMTSSPSTSGWCWSSLALVALVGAVLLAMWALRRPGGLFLRAERHRRRQAAAPGRRCGSAGWSSRARSRRDADGVTIDFVVGDGKARVPVRFAASCPTCSAKAAGVVAEGALRRRRHLRRRQPPRQARRALHAARARDMTAEQKARRRWRKRMIAEARPCRAVARGRAGGAAAARWASAGLRAAAASSATLVARRSRSCRALLCAAARSARCCCCSRAPTCRSRWSPRTATSAKPFIYKLAGAWGNHEGSMLLWVTVLALAGAADRAARAAPARADA